MKTTFLFCTIIISLASCKSENTQIPVSEAVKQELPEETFQSQSNSINQPLLAKLKNDLETEKFAIEKTVKEKSYTEYDGNRKINVVVRGAGITKYIIKRTEAKPEGYYPDFVLYVFELENEKLAKDCFAKLTMARFSPGSGEKRMKDVEVMTQNGNMVFILSTRAEMFRSYITDFVHRLNKY